MPNSQKVFQFLFHYSSIQITETQNEQGRMKKEIPSEIQLPLNPIFIYCFINFKVLPLSSFVVIPDMAPHKEAVKAKQTPAIY